MRVLLLVVLFMSGGSALAQEPGHSAHESLTLREVMQELYAGYRRLGEAVMLGNGERVGEEARAIAGHPMPESLEAALRHALGSDFDAFAAADQAAHSAAEKLAKSAAGDPGGMNQAFVDLTAACLACHITFQARMRANPGVVSSHGHP